MKLYLTILVVSVCASGVLSKLIGDTNIDDDAWWGRGPRTDSIDTSIRPYRIEFDDEVIEDLKYRLRHYRPPAPPLEGVAFEYGFNSDELEQWVHYWAEEYPFKEREAYLNRYPHYKTNIQGLDIHFIRVKPEVPRGMEVVPLLMFHGWPGSVCEFYEIIPQLAVAHKSRGYAVEVIVVSLVGFGYSDPAPRSGMGPIEMSVVFRNLMRRLGFKKYYIQGGDWGSFVATSLTTLYPEEVLGLHMNFIFSLNPKSLMDWVLGSSYTDMIVEPSEADRMYPLSKILKNTMRETGYYHLHSTKPDSIGIPLSDSPAGYLAYFLQIFSWGCDADNIYRKDGGLDECIDRVKFFDDLTIHWTANTITTSIRIYSEANTLRAWNSGVYQKPTEVPTWTIAPPHEIIYQSPKLMRHKFVNYMNGTVLQKGGHFLPMQYPEILAEDVLTAISAFRNEACRKMEF